MRHIIFNLGEDLSGPLFSNQPYAVSDSLIQYLRSSQML